MSILGTGSSALLAFQRALATISHNVANANTDGYSRQRVELAARPGNPYGYGFVGAGVETSAVTRLADGFHFSRALDSAAELGRLGTLAGLAERLDTAISDDATGLAAPWSAFFDAMQGVASQPASGASRQALLDRANAMATRVRSLDAQFKSIDVEVNAKIEGNVREVNRLSGEIARLNEEIVRQRGLAGGQQPNDLLDQRERLIQELSAKAGVVTAMQEDGAINVFTGGGQSLVVGTKAQALTTVADPFRPERRELALQSPSGPVPLGPGTLGGELGGLLEFRSQVLDPAASQLGRIAATVAYTVNAQHRQGMDLYGQMGGDFFRPITANVSPHALNTGGASLSGALADPAAFDGIDAVLTFDGASWSAVRRDNGQPVTLTGTGTAADPLRVGGMALVVSGSAAAGDRFLLRPASGAAGQLQVAITDPGRIAAASPLKASADLGNDSDATPSALAIADATAPGVVANHTVVFLDDTTYSVDGGPPATYDPATGIVGGGWTLKLEGTPRAGDRFDLAPRGPGSSDNGNMRALAALDDLGRLEGGQLSMNGALQQLTVATASAARQAGDARDAQGIIDQQVRADREALSGVNLDEEAANLLRFQQAYQAAAQVIAAADTVFQSLLSAVRR